MKKLIIDYMKDEYPFFKIDEDYLYYTETIHEGRVGFKVFLYRGDFEGEMVYMTELIGWMYTKKICNG